MKGASLNKPTDCVFLYSQTKSTIGKYTLKDNIHVAFNLDKTNRQSQVGMTVYLFKTKLDCDARLSLEMSFLS